MSNEFMCHSDNQTVLVLQGGGALGAFQVGAYQALHEAGIEPDWIIGTSIGAINAALIAGNPPAKRLEALNAFWERVTQPDMGPWASLGMGVSLKDMAVMTGGISGFFRPNPGAWLSANAQVGAEQAAYYDTSPLRETLGEFIDLDLLNAGTPRLTVGAVNVRTSAMRYFDSRHDTLTLDHILASGALPPAFPAVRIDGEIYWDGGINSNTPIEAVLEDNPRRDSLIFAINVWHSHGEEPGSIAQVKARSKDVQFSSRVESHIERQQQIQHLRHIINSLASQLPKKVQESEENRKLIAYGCRTTVHVAILKPPHLAGEGETKDIDFSASGIRTRRELGYARTQSMLERAPWESPVDPLDGVIVHTLDSEK
jgi:NTE family protein